MAKKPTFQDVIKESRKVIRQFEKVEKRKWGVEGSMMELSKQVGELARNVMMHEGYYMAGRDELPEYQTSKSKIADELSDVLYMVIRVADYYGIDLEKEHLKQLDIASKHPLMGVKRKSQSIRLRSHSARFYKAG
jgi:NTP pyrophosphatase (non-canonical NTP hydrolase)